MPAAAPALVSVVVPTYHRPELLERCLRALLVQDFDPTRYEIIVVDDAADEATQRQVERLADEAKFQRAAPTSAGVGARRPPPIPAPVESRLCLPGLKYLATRGRRGPATARNLGWRTASGEIIAFTDDDCLPAPDWLKFGVQACSADGVMGVGGRVKVPLPPEPTDFERETLGLERSEFVTANCFYRRCALEVLGGFDERFTQAWREDSELYFRMLEAGYRLAAVPQAVVVHPVRQASWGVSLNQQRKSLFNALIYKEHPQLYRSKLQPNPPWHYYAALAALAGGVVAGAAGKPSLALVSGSLWAILTLRFSLQRLRGTTHSMSHVVEMMVTSALIPPLCLYWRLRGAIKFRVFFL